MELKTINNHVQSNKQFFSQKIVNKLGTNDNISSLNESPAALFLNESKSVKKEKASNQEINLLYQNLQTKYNLLENKLKNRSNVSKTDENNKNEGNKQQE